MANILIIDDEPSIVTLIDYHVKTSGHTTNIAYDGAKGLEMATNGVYQLIILDIMLPEMNGFELCEKLRQNRILTPVLMLTAKSTEEDKLYGFKIGADDYLTKPFSPKELIARVQAMLRRSGEYSTNDAKPLRLLDLTIFPQKLEAYLKQTKLNLTSKEFELLLYLVRHKGQPMSREQLLKNVWEYDFIGESRIVDVHIGKLREKIEADVKQPTYIKSIYGVGYKMEDL